MKEWKGLSACVHAQAGVVAGLAFWGLMAVSAAAQEKEEKAPEGVKTKTESKYNISIDGRGVPKKMTAGRTVSQFDTKGHPVELAYYDADGKLVEKNLSKYDEKGREIEQARYIAGKLDWKSLSKYDEKGHKIESAWYDADGNLVEKNLSKYDDKGREIEQKKYDIQGGLEILEDETDIQYEYYGKKEKK